VLTVHDDEKSVRSIVARLTQRHEANESKPWKMGDSAPDFIDSMLRNIVGIEVEITSMVGKSKLSQNREARDRLNAAGTLDSRGHQEIANSMRQAG
jgi:transcriptional regulator